MSTERDRVISITLTEAEWQAFIARQPQPVNWLRDRIRERGRATAADATRPKSRRPRTGASAGSTISKTVARRAGHGNRAAVPLDDRLHDRQPQAAAARHAAPRDASAL